MRIATLDLGATTFHLEHFDVEHGEPSTSLDAKRYVGLGAALVERRHFDVTMRAKILEVVAELLELSRTHSPDRLAVVATSPFRQADNGVAMANALSCRHGTQVRVLSTTDEANFAYLGNARTNADARPPRLVVDVGGGSSELAVGEGSTPGWVTSLPLGALRLGRAEYNRADLSRALREILVGPMERVKAFAPRQVVFASGTARAVRELAARQTDTAGKTGPLSAADLQRCIDEHYGKSKEELAGLGVDPARGTTVLVGASIMEAVVRLGGFSHFLVSKRGVRDGVAMAEYRLGCHISHSKAATAR